MVYYNSMRLRLVSSSGVPIYRQIVEQISQQIACGRLSVGDRLPSVRELARELPANQNTVIKAYELLERDGLIQRRHGDGTFVAGTGSTLSAEQRRRMLAELLAHVTAQARLFGVEAAELHRLLDEQIQNFMRDEERRVE